MKKNKIIDVINLINPAFFQVWLSNKNNVALEGGRASTKSSVVSLKLVVEFLKEPEGNVICLRKVAKYLSVSVYEQIKWAIYMLGKENEFKFMKSPLQIVHKKTNTAFYFYGVDDPMKLKSSKIAKGYVMAVWFEELAEFEGVTDIDIVQDTFIRENLPKGKKVKTYYSWNPPRNPYAWINEWAEEKRKDDTFLIHHSTYLDDERGFLSPQMLLKIEQYKKTDRDYYNWMYLGKVIGLGDLVYNMDLFQPIKELPKDDRLLKIYFSTDTGHQISANASGCYALTAKGNVIRLGTYYYSPANKRVKKPPTEIAKDMNDFEKRMQKTYPFPIANRTVDSADGAIRNQYYKDYGLILNPVAKSKKATMIDYTTDLLGQGRFFYLDIPENQIFIDEHRKYQWNEKTLQSDNPEVLKVDDHTCDEFQYFVKDNLRDLRLKF